MARTVEVFTAGCPACDSLVQLVQSRILRNGFCAITHMCRRVRIHIRDLSLLRNIRGPL